MDTAISNGVWPVMITPFTADNKIDFDGVAEILAWYEKQKVTGIFAVCQSSEMFYLSREERMALAKFVIDNKGKDQGVIVSGHVAESVEDQAAEAREIIEYGVDSYVFISNQFAKKDEGEDVVKKNIENLLSLIPEGKFGIYECPHPYKRLISPELLKWCADTGNFTFLKDTCCNINEIKAKLKAVEGSSLKIYNANAATLLESLKAGAAGYSGVMANFHGDMYEWLCQNFDKDPEKAAVVQDFLGLASVIECQLYPTNAKFHMQLEGLNINLFSRVQDFSGLTSSRQLEVEQLRRSVNYIRQNILTK